MSNLAQPQEKSAVQSAAKTGIDICQILVAQSAIFSEQLTPYGEAAKAIFIKANGVTAYERELRFARRAD